MEWVADFSGIRKETEGAAFEPEINSPKTIDLKVVVMAMKITRLTTYWTAEEADTVMAFLDELRDTLWECYGEQIIDMRRNALARTEGDTGQTELTFDDDNIDF